MGNSKRRKAQGAWHKAEWERLRAWGTEHSAKGKAQGY